VVLESRSSVFIRFPLPCSKPRTLPSAGCDKKWKIMGGWLFTNCPICSPTPPRPVGGGSLDFNAGLASHASPRQLFSILFILLISKTTRHIPISFAFSQWSKLVRRDQFPQATHTHANASQSYSEHLVALARLVPPHITRAAVLKSMMIATLSSPESLSSC